MQISILVFIATSIMCAAAGFTLHAIIHAAARADLEAHIIALRHTLKKAHQHLLQYHRQHGGQMEILKQIETTVEATFDDEIF